MWQQPKYSRGGVEMAGAGLVCKVLWGKGLGAGDQGRVGWGGQGPAGAGRVRPLGHRIIPRLTPRARRMGWLSPPRDVCPAGIGRGRTCPAPWTSDYPEAHASGSAVGVALATERCVPRGDWQGPDVSGPVDDRLSRSSLGRITTWQGPDVSGPVDTCDLLHSMRMVSVTRLIGPTRHWADATPPPIPSPSRILLRRWLCLFRYHGHGETPASPFYRCGRANRALRTWGARGRGLADPRTPPSRAHYRSACPHARSPARHPGPWCGMRCDLAGSDRLIQGRNRPGGAKGGAMGRRATLAARVSRVGGSRSSAPLPFAGVHLGESVPMAGVTASTGPDTSGPCQSCTFGLAASLPRCLAASRPRGLAASRPRGLAASRPRCPAAPHTSLNSSGNAITNGSPAPVGCQLTDACSTTGNAASGVQISTARASGSTSQ